MEQDDKDHYLIYQVLGISLEEGEKIDLYQNIGRFLYRQAGGLVEEAVRKCFQYKYPETASVRIKNTVSSKPATFEID